MVQFVQLFVVYFSGPIDLSLALVYHQVIKGNNKMAVLNINVQLQTVSSMCTDIHFL